MSGALVVLRAVGGPYGYLEAQSRWRWPEVAFWIATLLPFVFLPAYLQLASQIAITALFALSLDLILGYAGIVSLGHAAFFGLGAYAAGLISKFGWGEPLSGLVIAAALAGVVGYATSFVIARFRHLALIMITLGMGLLLYEAANSASWLTGGADGLQGVRIRPLLERFPFDLWGRTGYTYSLAALFLTFLVARRLIHSPFGLSLRGIRENAVRMPALGAPSRAHLRKVYTIAAVMAGMAGAVGADQCVAHALGQRKVDVAGHDEGAEALLEPAGGEDGRRGRALHGHDVRLHNVASRTSPPRTPLGRNSTTAMRSRPIQKYQYCGLMPENWSRATM